MNNELILRGYSLEDALFYFHLPFLIIAIIIGYQISAYFIYTYLKNKKNGLKLDKILLAYGYINLFLISTILLRTIYTYSTLDSFTDYILFELSHIMLAIGGVSFLLLLSSNEFNEIISNKITRVIIVIAILITIIFYFIQDGIQNLIITIISMAIAAYYLLTFQYRLIKLTTGVIKKRLIIITMGYILMVFGIAFQADEIITILTQEDQLTIMIISNPIFVLGASIVFIGLFRFPAFLEFDWKDHLKSVYIIDYPTLRVLYCFDFVNESGAQEEVEVKGGDILFKGVIGIDKTFSVLTKTRENIEVIRQGDILIYVKRSAPPLEKVIYILIVKKERNSYNYLLKKITREFEHQFSSVMHNLESIKGEESRIFSSFDESIKYILR